MGFKYIQRIPTAEEICAAVPVTPAVQRIKERRDREIIDVFARASDKFILIIGPCSADNEDALCEYVSRLARVQEKVHEKIILIPRIYTNKPRTTGKGYKGMVHQPDPTEEPNLVNGITAIRRMHIRSLTESGLTAADEMLYPGNYPYLADILSYVAIGARSVENQQHRLTVSGLDIPVGMKNPTSGDLQVMLNSIEAAQSPHRFIYHEWEVCTHGNPLSHAILRGAINQHGQAIPNYHYKDMVELSEMYLKRQLLNPTIIIDTNHANSNKCYRQQPRIAREVIRDMKSTPVLRDMVKGLMIESYLQEGSQEIPGHEYGKSITDACLGWDDSETLIYDIASAL